MLWLFYLGLWGFEIISRSGRLGFDVWWLHYLDMFLYFIFIGSPLLLFYFEKRGVVNRFIGMMLCLGIGLQVGAYFFRDIVKYDDENMELFCAEDGYAWDKVKKVCVR